MQQSGKLIALLGVLAAALTGSQPSTAAPGSRVSGGGQYNGTAGLTHVTVNAVEKPDGSVSGQFEQENPDNGKTIVHGTITCLDFVNDTTALVSGIITDAHKIPDSLSFIQPGAPFILLVQDNGEGQGSSPDQVSLFDAEDVGVVFPCGDPGFIALAYSVLLPYTFPLTAGNFQVSR